MCLCVCVCLRVCVCTETQLVSQIWPPVRRVMLEVGRLNEESLRAFDRRSQDNTLHPCLSLSLTIPSSRSASPPHSDLYMLCCVYLSGFCDIILHYRCCANQCAASSYTLSVSIQMRAVCMLRGVADHQADVNTTVSISPSCRCCR